MLQSKRLVVLVGLLVVGLVPVTVLGLLLAGVFAVTPVRAEVELLPETGPEIASVGLPQAAAGEALFVNEADGYALLYPEGFSVTQPEEHIAVVSGPDEFPGPEPSRGWLNIDATTSAEGMTAVEFSNQVVEPFMPFTEEFYIERTDNVLGGEPAVEIIGVPGQNLSWQVLAVHEGTLYRLTFSPLGEENGQAFVDMQAIYQLAMGSFTFID